MKHDIPTPQGRYTVTPQPEKQGVRIAFKSPSWPEVFMVLSIHQAVLLGQALDLCALEIEAGATH